MLLRQIIVPARSCSLLKMVPRQYFTLATFDVSLSSRDCNTFDTCNIAEPWWVNTLIRNPVVLPYTHGLKRLDKIYLDTTFASKEKHCQKFPAKADGLEELLQKVFKYPVDTVFHFNAWTFGYEEVWIALSSALRSQVRLFLTTRPA